MDGGGTGRKRRVENKARRRETVEASAAKRLEPDRPNSMQPDQGGVLRVVSSMTV
jgi:hypothetical protein